jgi:UDP-N-acetyl-D-mannosaminuronic acid dehydrogenase
MREKIGVIGLGYIGLPLLGALADVGYQVMGMDVDREKISRLKKNCEPEIYEPGLCEALKRHSSAIEFTASMKQLMTECDVIMITVGTPLNDDETPDEHAINKVISETGKYLRKGQLIVLKSTVLPGTTRKMASSLKELSGLEPGKDFHLAFFPERTIEGLALHELHTLSKIVGGINQESTNRAARIIGKLGGKVIKVSSPEVAEMCKIIDNTYRSINVALANEIGLVCEQAGLDAYEVVGAVNEGYARTQLAKSGLGANGPCLSKDPQLLAHYAKQKGIHLGIISAGIADNKEATLRVAKVAAQFIKSRKLKKATVSLVGLAFKGFPETDDTRHSPAIMIKEALEEDFSALKYRFYDPLITQFCNEAISPGLKDSYTGANIVMFLTNHPSLMGIRAEDIMKNAGRPLLVIDCWHNVSDPEKIIGNDTAVFRVGDGTI